MNIGSGITITSKIPGEATGGRVQLTDGHGFKSVRVFEHNERVPAEINHIHKGYNSSGIYTFHGSFFCAGHLYTDTEVICVLPNLGSYRLDLVKQSIPQDEEFEVRVVQVTGHPSSCLNATFDWGDGSPKTVLPLYEVGMPVRHTYTMSGQYSISAFLQYGHQMSSIGPMKVNVGEAIRSFMCYVHPSRFCEVNSEFEILATFISNEPVNVKLLVDGALVATGNDISGKSHFL